VGLLTSRRSSSFNESFKVYVTRAVGYGLRRCTMKSCSLPCIYTLPDAVPNGTGGFRLFFFRSAERPAMDHLSMQRIGRRSFFASGIFLEYRSMALACLGYELWSAFERQMVLGSLYEELVACI
jgi:hypothetical protein